MKKRALAACICVFLSIPFSSRAEDDFQIFLKQETVASTDLITAKRLTVNAVNNTGEDMHSVIATCEGQKVPLGDIASMHQVQAIGEFPVPSAATVEGIPANVCQVEYSGGDGQSRTLRVPPVPVP